MFTLDNFPQCPICGSADWVPGYEGPVRDGPVGRQRPGAIARCRRCSVDRLAESACLNDEAYSGAYRGHVGQDHDVVRHYEMHDELARFTLDVIWPVSLRDKTVADVGCGGGSLLDHIRGLTSDIIAIDPDQGFAPNLQKRGYHWAANTAEAGRAYAGKVDVAFSIQVIEHVENPRDFLAGIRQLLKPDGMLVLSTPNRRDILLELLPDVFPSHFYRTHHRWYFDAESLTAVAQSSGLQVQSVRHVHRYGIANAMLWLREQKPSGRTSLDVLDSNIDDLWRSWLESQGRSDNLYVVLRPA